LTFNLDGSNLLPDWLAYVRTFTVIQLTTNRTYLSPQDPDYFTAGSVPVALYRYRLEFFPHEEAQN
jgi:hypothetical protein